MTSWNVYRFGEIVAKVSEKGVQWWFWSGQELTGKY